MRYREFLVGYVYVQPRRATENILRVDIVGKMANMRAALLAVVPLVISFPDFLVVIPLISPVIRKALLPRL
jgi:hypothetical protein